MKKAIYPGSFDPVTLGHVDIAKRAAGEYDKLFVVVMENDAKHCLFTMDERVELLKESFKDVNNIEVLAGHGLTVEFARELGAYTIIKGLRAVTDFEYELQQATMNMSLAPDIETVFLMSQPKYSFLSSSSVKTIASYGGKFDEFVPPCVVDVLKEKYQK